MASYQVLQYCLPVEIDQTQLDQYISDCDIVIFQRCPWTQISQLHNCFDNVYFICHNDGIVKKDKQIHLAIAMRGTIKGELIKTYQLPSRDKVIAGQERYQSHKALSVSIREKVNLVSVSTCGDYDNSRVAVNRQDNYNDIEYLLQKCYHDTHLICGDFHESPGHGGHEQLLKNYKYDYSFLNQYHTYYNNGRSQNLDRCICNSPLVTVENILVYTPKNLIHTHCAIRYQVNILD